MRIAAERITSRQGREEAQSANQRYKVLYLSLNAINDDQTDLVRIQPQLDCYFLDRHRVF